jgi:hypothetical protein
VVQNISAAEKDTLVQAALASGGTDPASTYVDMANFDTVVFRGILGTAGSTDVCTLAAWGSSSTGSTGTAISGATITSTAGKDDMLMKIEVSRPRTRYVKTHLTRSAAVEYGGTIATQYSGRVEPVTDDATTVLTRVLKVPQTT